jgi:hypothetical protein
VAVGQCHLFRPCVSSSVEQHLRMRSERRSSRACAQALPVCSLA